jgi:hypothetical protein
MSEAEKRFGRLTVICEVKGGLLCRCACGNFKVVKRYHLIRPNSRGVKSCGCSARGIRPRSRDIGVRLAYSEKKYSAKRMEVEFDLTLNQYKRLISQNCHYCNKPPVLRGREGYKFIGQESLDRKDPYGDYTIDNVVPCCLSCNVKKNVRPYRAFMSDMELSRELAEMRLAP